MTSQNNVLVVFRSRMRADADFATVEAMVVRMYELASAMPGFVAYKDYAATDGESVSIVEFTDTESLKAWRDHPEHVEVRRRGREEFMATYDIQVCRIERAYSFERTG